MATYEEDLIKRARELQRLATKRRRLKRQLKQTDADIKHARKLLNAVKQASEGRRPDIAPNRLDAGVSGFTRLDPRERVRLAKDANANGSHYDVVGRGTTIQSDEDTID